ncbi:MAG: hypothetical protein LBT29_04800 [Flavobacteriaceae bacterium]|jgi:hypothetical protein|nr:hypothetical protein [Flavobacteriaceae bacterium]
MNVETNYLKIEEKIIKSTKRAGYIIIFTILGLLLMTVVDFILWCLLDNYSLLKFLFTGEQNFFSWLRLMWRSYAYSWEKLLVFGVIFIFIGNYRSKIVAKALED